MDNDMLEKVLSYIDNHVYEKIWLKDLSIFAAYSPFYFSKLFSEVMGMPVTSYIRIRKLQHAIVSLLEGHKVLDVALLYAFDSHEGFTRAFKQLFGSTPNTIKKYLTTYTIPTYIIPTNNRRINMKITNDENLQNNMYQLVFEFLNQSFEEAKAGFCTKIEISLLPENNVKITDNGRGLPLSKNLPASKLILEKILAGKPITNAEYSQMGDFLHPSLQIVNSLCESLQIKVNINGNQYQQDYIRGIAQHDLYVIDSTQDSGTEIILKPDTRIFMDLSFSQKVISDWIKDKLANIINLKINIYEC